MAFQPQVEYQLEPSLADVITPDKLELIFKLKVPWDKSDPPTGRTVQEQGAGPDQVKAATLDEVLAISKFSLDEVPDMSSFLPPATTPEYPEQALGLLQILDQAPRAYFNGVNARWTNSFFDHLALKLSKQFLALPKELRPDTLERWLSLGYKWQHWAFIKILFIAPIAHSESMEDQEIMGTMVDELRETVEKLTGTTDPNRGNGLRESKKVLAFSEVMMKGQPQSEKMEDWIYWFCEVLDAHPPIIRVFGRYPYRNGACGRESTDEEKKFVEETKGFGAIDEESAKLILEDVKAGKWTPLKFESA